MKSKVADWLTGVPIETADGVFVARYSQQGLAVLDFPSRSGRGSPGGKPVAVPKQVRAFHRLTASALKRVLAGRAPGPLPPLDLSAGTNFQQHVWGELRNIASGGTRSYGEIAKAIGKPKAVRAVGGACGANPIPVLVPCHRVLAANRKLGGFSGGLPWKVKLLNREGIGISG